MTSSDLNLQFVNLKWFSRPWASFWTIECSYQSLLWLDMRNLNIEKNRYISDFSNVWWPLVTVLDLKLPLKIRYLWSVGHVRQFALFKNALVLVDLRRRRPKSVGGFVWTQIVCRICRMNKRHLLINLSYSGPILSHSDVNKSLTQFITDKEENHW